MSGGKSVPALRRMDDCEVFGLWATDQHTVYFMGTRSVVIVIFCYSQHSIRRVKSLMWGKAHQPSENSLILSLSYGTRRGGRKRGKKSQTPRVHNVCRQSWARCSPNGLLLFQEKKMTGFYFLTTRHPLPARYETDLKNYARCSHTLLLSSSLSL